MWVFQLLKVENLWLTRRQQKMILRTAVLGCGSFFIVDGVGVESFL